MEGCLILIDYANFYWDKINISQLINLVINSLKEKNVFVSSVNIRIYGGWFFNTSITQQRIEAINIMANWPSIIRVSGKIYRINYNFADALYNYASYDLAQIKYTFIERKEKPRNIRFQKSENISRFCNMTDCNIKNIRKWLKSDRACINSDCSERFSDYFVRFEQKQVDAHILVDFMHIINRVDNHFVFVMSDDMDFLPCMQYAVVNGMSKRIGLLHTGRINPYMYEILTCADIPMVQVEE